MSQRDRPLARDAPLDLAEGQNGLVTRQIDPRSATWEDEFPVYRVVFWEEDAADEWDVESAPDVHRVIAWATEKARGRSFTLSVVARFADDEGVLRILGEDPTRT